MYIGGLNTNKMRNCVLVCLTLMISCSDSRSLPKEVFAEPYVENMDTVGMADRANQFYKGEEFLKAKRLFDRLLSLDSTNANWYFKRAYSESILLGDYINIINDYKQALRYNYMNKTSIYFNMGFIYEFIGKYDSALYYYHELKKIDPNHIEANEQIREIQLKGKKLR